MTIGYTPTLLFNHSPLEDLELKNLDLYPTNFSASISDGTLEWSNVNFQSEGPRGSRVWQFRGSGFSGNKSVAITYSVETTEQFQFDANATLSGILTTSKTPYAITLSESNTNFSYSRNNQLIIIIFKITVDSALEYFDYNLFKSDEGFEICVCNIFGLNCCGNGCCSKKVVCCNGGCCPKGYICSNGGCCQSGYTYSNGGCCRDGYFNCNGTCIGNGSPC